MHRAALMTCILFAGCIVPTTPTLETGDDADSRPIAHALLADSAATIVFEVDYHPDAPPSDESLDQLVTVAEDLTGKTARIDGPTPIPQNLLQRENEYWTLGEFYALSAAARDIPRTLDTVSLHVLYLDEHIYYQYRGEWSRAVGVQAQDVLGVWYDNALFRIGSTSGPATPAALPGGSTREIGILQHEFGHALGLVNNGIPMVRPHNDPDDPAHSNNPDSIMAGGWDLLDDVRAKFTRGEHPSLRFDDDDLADIKAYRESVGKTSPMP